MLLSSINGSISSHLRKIFILLALATAGPVPAAGATGRDFDLPAQALADSLRAVGSQASVNVVFEPSAVRDKRAPALRGSYSVQEALQRLLDGTGLSVRVTNGGSFVIATADIAGNGVKGSGKAASGAALRLAKGEGFASADGSDTNGQQSSADSQSAQAAEESARQESGRLEEVVVTATKRAENIQDVPISIAVLTAEDIDRRGLVNAEDYLRGIPGTSQVESMGGGQAIVIRGIETSLRAQNFGSGATTGTYFGETSTTASAGALGSNVDIKLVDIERIEVLRGPQGTAFGSSALGGAVRQIPVAPKLDRVEGRLGAGYSATSGTGGENYNFQAIGNVPLIAGKLAIRGTAYAFSDSGYYRNRAASNAVFQATRVIPFGAQAFATDEEEQGAYYSRGGRISALFQATDKLRFTLNYLTQKNETDGMSIATSGTYEQTLLRVAPEHVRRGQTGGVADADIDIANAVMELDLGWSDLLATYSHVKSGMVVMHPTDIYNIPQAASASRDMDHRENAGEVRLATKFDGAWNFLAGVYVERYDDDYFADQYWVGDPATNNVCAACVGQRFLFDYLDRRDLEQNAAFGEVSWKFLPRFTLTGGVRAYEYERSIRIDQGGPLIGPRSSTLTKNDESGAIYRANLSFKPTENALVYAGWSQGFRLGKPQQPPPATVCDTNGDGLIDGTNATLSSAGSVESDSVDNYELGGKVAAFGRRLTLDTAIFRMDWSGLPIAVRPPCAFTYLTGAGDARSEGMELQGSLQVIESLRVDFGGSYVNARILEDVPAQGFKAGDRLPGSPKINANLGIQRDFKMLGRVASVRADAIYVGEFFGDVLGSPTTRAGDYVKIDASARIAFDNLSLDLFVRNLTNEDAFTYRSNYGAFAVGNFYGYRMRPRTVGLQIGYTF